MLLRRRVWRALSRRAFHRQRMSMAFARMQPRRCLTQCCFEGIVSTCCFEGVRVWSFMVPPLAKYDDHLCAAQALWAADLCVSVSRSRFSCARRWRPEDQLAPRRGPSPLVQQHRPHGVQLQLRGSSSSLHAACRAMQHRRRPMQAPMHRHHSQACTMAGVAACLPAMPSPQHATSLACSCLRPHCMQQQLRTATATALPHPTFWPMCCQSSSPLKPSSQASN